MSSTLPCYCTECAPSPQPLATSYLSGGAGLSKPVTIIPNTYTKKHRYPDKAQFSYNSGECKPVNSNTQHKISSVPVYDYNPSNRARSRSLPQYQGFSYSANESRRRNGDLPAIPTQDTSSSKRGPQQTKCTDETRNPHLGSENPSIPSVPTSIQKHNSIKRVQITPKPQQLLETQVPYNAAKPQDPRSIELSSIPSIPIQERSQSNYSQKRPQYQETQLSYRAAKPQDPRTVEPSSILSAQVQEQSQSNYSQSHGVEPSSITSVQERNSHRTTPQPRETQVSSSANKSQDHAEQSTSMPTQDQGQDRTANANSKTDTRPHLMHGTPSQMDTQYVNMLLALDDIPSLHNMYAAFFNWILLAGFILFPGTFTSLENIGATGAAQQLLHVITNIPLFVIAFLCTGIGAIGMAWLWWRWRNNYIWALNKIFLPGAMNSLAGFISTIVNIFGAQHGELSDTSKITVVVTAVSTGVLGILTVIYSLWLVKRVKAKHDREVGKERAGKHGEGVVDLSKRKADV